MRISTKFASIVCALIFCECPAFPQQLQGKASIEGVVTRSPSNEPVADAQVTLAGIATPTSGTALLTLETDKLGHFAFRDLDAGSFRLTIMKNGYVKHEYGQRVTNGPVPPLVIGAAEQVRDIVVQLTPAGTVSGSIRNSSGRPLGNIQVQLFRRVYTSSGGADLQSVATVKTNDLGEYRIYWVAPGRYYLGAGSSPSPLQISFESDALNGNNAVQINFANSFFPGVTEIERAAVLSLQPEEELRGVDLVLSRQRPYRIHGHVIDLATGKAPADASVSIYRGGGFSTATYHATEGTFETMDLTPGTYLVAASANSAGSSLRASATVDANSDVSDLVLTLDSRVIKGRIRVESQSSQPASIKLDGLRVLLRPANPRIPVPSPGPPGLASPLVSPPVRADGTFTLSGVPDDAFRVTVSSLPAGFYIKDASLDGMDVLTSAARFSDSSEIDIVISPNSGSIEGQVNDERRQPLAGILTVLIPDKTRTRTDLFKNSVSDSKGHFSFSGVPPGDYKVFAWEALEPLSYFDPEVLKEFEQMGTSVHVDNSSQQAIEVPVIRSGRTR